MLNSTYSPIVTRSFVPKQPSAGWLQSPTGRPASRKKDKGATHARCAHACPSKLRLQRYVLSLHLCPHHQLRRQQTLRLVLRCVCAVRYVSNKLRPERKRQAIAVDISRRVFVHDKQIVALLSASNIDILTRFDVSVRPEDEESSIAPRPQAIRSKPVKTDVPEALVAAQHHVAEVLELRLLWMVHIRHLRCHYLGGS